MFKSNDLKVLTAEAAEACAQIGIDPDSLQVKPIEFFQSDKSEPAELTQVRLQHYQKKRKSKLQLQHVDNVIKIYNQVYVVQTNLNAAPGKTMSSINEP